MVVVWEVAMAEAATAAVAMVAVKEVAVMAEETAGEGMAGVRVEEGRRAAVRVEARVAEATEAERGVEAMAVATEVVMAVA